MGWKSESEREGEEWRGVGLRLAANPAFAPRSYGEVVAAQKKAPAVKRTPE